MKSTKTKSSGSATGRRSFIFDKTSSNKDSSNKNDSERLYGQFEEVTRANQVHKQYSNSFITFEDNNSRFPTTARVEHNSRKNVNSLIENNEVSAASEVDRLEVQ